MSQETLGLGHGHEPFDCAACGLVIIALVAEADENAVLIAAVSERGRETTPSTGC